MINITHEQYELAVKPLGIALSSKSVYSFRDDVCIEGPCEIKTSVNGIVAFGAYSYINGAGRFSDVRIGRYCSIAESVTLGYPEHPLTWLSTSSLQYQSPSWAHLPDGWQAKPHRPVKTTVIGNDVWIGAGSFIRSGVTIGDGAVVGAHSVVTKDVPPYAIVAGNPARLLRYRFDDEMITKLISLAWWNYDFRDFHGIDFSDVGAAITLILERVPSINPYLPPRLTKGTLEAKLQTLKNLT